MTLKLNEIDQMIRQGKALEARRALKALATRRLPRESTSAVAALLRRVGNHSTALRLLNKYVRGSGKQVADANDIEKTEYAANLIRVGVLDEAVQILQSVDRTVAPQSLLFQALAYFPEWNYSAAVPLLDAYTKIPSLEPYPKLIGEVNLSSALIDDNQWNRAEPLLMKLLEETVRQNLTLLHGNVLELLAQGAILNKKWAEAEKFLRLGKESLQGGGSIDEFFLNKWEAIFILRSRGYRKAAGRIEKIRVEALKREHWETLRDLDRHLCVVQGDTARMLKIYFGTPFTAFRKQLLQDFPKSVSLPPYYLLDQAKKPAVKRLDLRSGEWTGREGGKSKTIQMEGALLDLVVALSSDFYRPARIPVIYRRLYKGEFFHPDTSPLRVRQTLKRLRQWLKAKKIPFHVTECRGFYRISDDSAIGLTVYQDYPANRKANQMMALLEKPFSNREFSAGEAQTILKLPRRSISRHLSEAVTEGFLMRSGERRSALYKIIKK